VAAAIGYYRAMLDPARHVARYAAEQDATTQVGSKPYLYVHGARDGCLDVEMGKQADQHLPPGSRVHIVADAGHFPQLERPAEIAAQVLAWIA
jgi:pimeloyl-ACP methyl ester carboxylesterase